MESMLLVVVANRCDKLAYVKYEEGRGCKSSTFLRINA